MSATEARLPPVARLFGKNKVRDLAQIIPTDQIQDDLKVIQAWVDDYHSGTLLTDKETSREQSYNNDIFMTVLGYKQQPASPHTFEPKATTSGNQFPDALISYTDKTAGIENVSAVVELKGAKIDLDRPQRREGNLSPVQQAFKYKPQYQSCPFVIVSNFYEFRLYNDNQLDYERWTLDDLVDPADEYVNLKTFKILLRASSLTSATGKSKTETWLSDIRQEQEEIGKKFYEEYQKIRLFLLKDIWTKNPATRFQFGLAIQKAQTIIDRVVFACFAEDSGLLPDNITASIVKEAKESSYGLPFFDHLKDFFRAIDQGKATLGIPKGYNGGLFAEDKWIDALTISDGPLIRLMQLGKYDFVNDLSVNILGHIFEQSISDLEEIKRAISADKANAFDPAVLEPRPATSKRKKEGIFYTPDHIVRYIVDQTVGSFLRAHEQRLIAQYRLHENILEKTYAQREQQAYTQYQVILQGIRVLDPACGSGAFLVYAFDYLRAENERVNAILGGGTLLGTEEYISEILKNNLFGVDLNEESVEITKLSLWLKTAKRGQQLTSLDANIKPGNSLIHDATVTDKAFDWTAFQGKRYDVVLGNPPYVDSESMVVNMPDERVWIAKAYESAAGNWDLFVPFVEKGLSLLSDDEVASFGFIMPNKVLGADYAQTLRGIVDTRYSLREIVDVSREKVFAEADVYPVILIAGHTPPADTVTITRSIEPRVQESVDFTAAYTRNWTEYLATQRDLLVKLSKLGRLGDTLTVHASTTVDEAYNLIEHLSSATIVKTDQLKLINTGTIDRYTTLWGAKPTQYIKKQYPNPVVAKADCPKKPWLDLPRIVLAGMASIVEAFPDPDMKYFAGVSTVVVTASSVDELYYATGILNSPVMSAYFREMYNSEAMAGGYINVKPNGIRDLPFVSYDDQDSLHQSIVADSRALAAAHQKLLGLTAGANRFLLDTYKAKPDRNADLVGLGYEKLIKRLGKLTVKEKSELHEWFVDKDQSRQELVADVDALELKVANSVDELFGVSGWMPVLDVTA